MRRYPIVEKAATLALKLAKANGMNETFDTLLIRIYSWYENTDITDEEILAACGLMGRPYFTKATYEDMIDARKWWFPHDPYENIPPWSFADYWANL